MNPRDLLLWVIAATTHWSSTAVAQQALIGVGLDASHIDPSDRAVPPDFIRPADTRLSSSLRAGFGGRRVKLVLEWQRHGWGDGQPMASDFQNVARIRRPEVLRTEFWLLGLR